MDVQLRMDFLKCLTTSGDPNGNRPHVGSRPTEPLPQRKRKPQAGDYRRRDHATVLVPAAAELSYEGRREGGGTGQLPPLATVLAARPERQVLVCEEGPHVGLRHPIGRPHSLPLYELCIAFLLAARNISVLPLHELCIAFLLAARNISVLPLYELCITFLLAACNISVHSMNSICQAQTGSLRLIYSIIKRKQQIMIVHQSIRAGSMLKVTGDDHTPSYMYASL